MSESFEIIIPARGRKHPEQLITVAAVSAYPTEEVIIVISSVTIRYKDHPGGEPYQSGIIVPQPQLGELVAQLERLHSKYQATEAAPEPVN